MTNSPAKWIISVLCLLIIFVIAIFAKNQQPLSAGGISATELKPYRPSSVRQIQDIDKIAARVDSIATKPSIWPTSGEVSSGFGWRNSPWEDGNELHQGIDIANSLETPIVATADGQVVQSGWAGGYGNVVQIDHGNGIATIYGHNSRIVVHVDQNVRKGQIISYLGSTGKSTGPHVHYEIRVNGVAVDPIRFMILY